MLTLSRLLSRPHPYRPLLAHPRISVRYLWPGLGEVVGVLTAPGQTLQQLSDVRKKLKAVRAEMEEEKERARLPPVSTFVQLQQYFPRKKEESVLERILRGPPEFTVLFGATSVGKTAMLRQILTSPEYAVLPLDLRIPGSLGTQSTYLSLSSRFEEFFLQLTASPGYGWDGLAQERSGILDGEVRRPMLVPMTPAIRWAMGRVVSEMKA